MLPGDNFKGVANKACELVKLGFNPVPHFPARSIKNLEELKVKRYKIASRTCLMKDPFSYETLQKKSSTKKPVIISMGMGGNKRRINN